MARLPRSVIANVNSLAFWLDMYKDMGRACMYVHGNATNKRLRARKVMEMLDCGGRIIRCAFFFFD